MPTQSLHLTISSITYSALLSGPPSAPVILLTHALMSSLHMWDSLTTFLNTHGYRVLRFDHIGHNLTPPPPQKTSTLTNQTTQPQTFSTDSIVHYMHALVRLATGQSKLKAIIGCSIGGVLALRYGMLFPEEVESVLSLCAPGIASLEASKPLWTQRIQQFEEDLRTGQETLCLATVERWLPGNEPHDKAVRTQALGHVRTCSLEGYRILADAIRGYDYSDQLERLEGVECVIVAGGRDKAVDVEVLRDLAVEIPPAGARFVVMEDAGHIPPMHRAEDFEALVLDVLGEGGGGGNLI
jgi:3-oxoadipate enol-lactonase